MPSSERISNVVVPLKALSAQACFNCTDRESAFEFQRMLMIAEINRLGAELDRALAALRRDSHSMDPREPFRGRG